MVHIVVNIEKRTNIAANQPALSTSCMQLVSAHWVLMQLSLLLQVGLDAVKLVTFGGS